MRLPLPIILIIIPVVLLVIFGRNPLEEAQKKQLSYGTDPLVAAINMHLEQEEIEKQKNFGFFSGGTAPKTPAPEAATNEAPFDPDFGANTLSNDMFSGVDTSGSAARPKKPQAYSGYYPPVVGGGSNKTVTLRSGQKITFSNGSPYVIDATGNRTLLRDGNYPLMDGSTMIIQNGSRVR